MRRDRDPSRRCADCQMLHALCICALVPRIATRTHLVLILHQAEARKPTNTGQLATRSLPNSRTVLRGGGRPADLGPLWPPDHEPLLLYPRPDARPLAAFVGHCRKVALVVPDGTWPQASRTCNRVAALKDITAVTLPGDDAGPPAPTAMRLRTPRLPGQRSTLEAIALALEVLEESEGPMVRQALEDVYRVMVERTLWARGRLTAAEVTGGIPPGAREAASVKDA